MSNARQMEAAAALMKGLELMRSPATREYTLRIARSNADSSFARMRGCVKMAINQRRRGLEEAARSRLWDALRGAEEWRRDAAILAVRERQCAAVAEVAPLAA